MIPPARARPRNSARGRPARGACTGLAALRPGCIHSVPLLGVAPKAAPRIAASVASSPASSATTRPPRMTSTRCARPRTSSMSEEITSTPTPLRSARPAARRSPAWRRRPRRGWARPRSVPAGRAASDRANSSFCWLPPDSDDAGSRLAAAAPDVHPGQHVPHRCAAPRPAGPCRATADLGEGGQAHVLRHRAAEQQALLLARLGDHRAPRPASPSGESPVTRVRADPAHRHRDGRRCGPRSTDPE